MRRIHGVDPPHPAMQILGLGLEIDRLARERRLHMRIHYAPNFFTEHVADRLADNLLARETEPPEVCMVTAPIAQIPADIRDECRQGIRDQFEMLFAPLQGL